MSKSTNFISLISDLCVVSFDSKRTQSLCGFSDEHDGCSSHVVLRPFWLTLRIYPSGSSGFEYCVCDLWSFVHNLLRDSQDLLLIYYIEKYSYLLDDHDQSNFPEHYLNQLAQLFIQYNAQKIFDLHLIYGHLEILHNTIMLGSSFKGRLSNYWTKLTSFEVIISNSIHEYIYTHSLVR